MSFDCNLIQSGIGSCTDKTSKGYTQRALIGNRAHVDTLTYDTTTALITALTMGGSTPMYEVWLTSTKPFEEFKVTAEDKKFGKLFKNEITLWIKGLTPTSVQHVNVLSKGEFFMGLEQRGAAIPEKYIFIGLQSSLVATAMEWNQAEGAWSVVLTEDMCDGSGLFLYTGSAGATTETTWDNLVL
jgi:hypothetical protein